MKNKFILLGILFLYSSLFAQKEVIIDNNFDHLRATSYIEFIQDTKKQFHDIDILKLKNMKPLTFSNNGFNSHRYWTRLQVENSSNKVQEIVFENPRAGMDYIDVSVFKDSSLEHKFFLGDLRPITNRSYQSLKSNFSLILLPKEKVTIITKLSTNASLELGWDIYTKKSFLSNEYFQYGLFGLFVGFIVTLIVVTVFIYWHSKSSFILIFTLFLINTIFLQMCLQGVLYLLLYKFFGYINFHLYEISGYISSVLFHFLWYLMVLSFFNLKQKAPLWRIYFIAILILLSSYLVIFIFAYFFPSLLSLIQIMIKIAFFNMFTLLIFLFWSIYKKFFGSIEFFLATLSGKLMFLVLIFDFLGQGEIFFLSKYGILLSGVLSALFLSLALFRKITLIQKESLILKEQLEKQRKYAMISKTISFISHQWRQPISKLGSMAMNFQSEIEHNPNKKIIEFKPQINRFNDTLYFINQTIKDIQSLFQVGNNKIEEFKIDTVIDQSLYQLDIELSSYNIQIEKGYGENLIIKGDPDLLKQVFVSLLQNTVDIIHKRSIEKPWIKIRVKRTKDTITILICDNGGGIIQQPPENIFDIYVSENSQSAGLGLSIVKQIIELKFQGTITVKNNNEGACFQIVI